MSLSLYKPNSKNTGCAFNFKIGTSKKNEPTLYVSSIQQFGWDNKTKTGNFSGNTEDPDKNIHVKFNEWEVGSIISAFENRTEYSTFHAFEENKTTIKFTPWDKPIKVSKQDPKTKKYVEETVISPAFGIVFTRNGNQTFRVPIEAGEVETIKEFFRLFLSTLLKERYRKDQERVAHSRVKESASDSAPF
ncbi:MAG: hypothetical protein CL512_03910 [Actinobacteria bacterium]|nr:hypothetical protein [Actinomycetota bacterium]|tara:strand:+ start:306 stop:875 length:570 start_codon:yes stop_codon:yes gene_type:complete